MPTHTSAQRFLTGHLLPKNLSLPQAYDKWQRPPLFMAFSLWLRQAHQQHKHASKGSDLLCSVCTALGKPDPPAEGVHGF